MKARSPNLGLGEPDSSIVPHIALWMMLVAALGSAPFRGRNIIFGSLLVVLAVYCNLHPHFTNDFGLAQPFSIAWSFYLSTLAKLIVAGHESPEDRFWRIGRRAKEARAFTAFGWKKMQWAFVLITNLRGIGWNYQVKNVPNVTKTTRLRFVAGQLGYFVLYACAADLMYELHRRMNFTGSDGSVGLVDSKHLTLNHPYWGWRLAKTFTFGVLPFFMISMESAMLAIVAVASGLSRPEDWPSTFGRFQDMGTLRSFWGKFWHQRLRHMLITLAEAFCALLRIRRGTTVSSYTKLYVAFFISGSFHALGQLHLPRPSNITREELTRGYLYFFMWQAAAISVEDFMIWLGRRSRWAPTSPAARTVVGLLGYVWVFCSLSWSLPWVGDIILRLRVGTGSFLPFPLARSFVEAYVPVPSQ